MPPKFVSLEDTRYCIFNWEILTRPKNLPNQDGAKQLLGRCIPVLNKLCEINKTCVVSIHEFFPRNASLLGLNYNGGEKIQVRLRAANDKSKLFCFEEVLCTLCHELAHNFVGPHNEEFWRTYRKFVSQAEEFLTSTSGGILGGNGVNNPQQQQQQANFQGQGHRLGASENINNNNPRSNNYSDPNKVFQGPGKRLGGDANAVSQAARNNRAGQQPHDDFMRQLVLGAVLKRFVDRDQMRCRQTQDANNTNNNSTCCQGMRSNETSHQHNNNNNTAQYQHQQQQRPQAGFLSQISPSCGTRQTTDSIMMRNSISQRNSSSSSSSVRPSQEDLNNTNKKQNIVHHQNGMNTTSSSNIKIERIDDDDDDAGSKEKRNQIAAPIMINLTVEDEDEPWACDLCGRSARGTFCSWCCGDDQEELQKGNNDNSTTSNSSSSNNNNNMMMMGNNSSTKNSHNYNDDDDDDDYDAFITSSNDVYIPSSSSKEKKKSEAGSNMTTSKAVAHHHQKKSGTNEDRRRTREKIETIELD